jgi:hypothetical protein
LTGFYHLLSLCLYHTATACPLKENCYRALARFYFGQAAKKLWQGAIADFYDFLPKLKKSQTLPCRVTTRLYYLLYLSYFVP